ncbi:MAG: DUF2235 domain-containing protein [Sulfitobacter sp.]|nr:DUF2235 domain-containing protein [Sulfitobacter sp.]
MSPSRQSETGQGTRAPATHVIILDGTLSSLVPLCMTNAARTYRLLQSGNAPLALYYEPGLQWRDWRSALHVLSGKGINRQIRRAYGHLARHYHPGDRIFLFGYSRGAYAVRSLAGVIDRVGLLRPDRATPSGVIAAYRHYEKDPDSDRAAQFRAAHCQRDVQIEMVGVWDTVKSLGINAPFLWRLSEHLHAFHNHDLGQHIKAGFHALAHDETRVAFSPVLWTCDGGFDGRVEQVWFPGAHGDVGGQLGGFEAARPLANLSLVWMLERAEEHGLPLPDGWRNDLPCDPLAPARGTWRGHGRWLMTRRRRQIGLDASEKVHPSVHQRAEAQAGKRRWGRLGVGASRS